MWHRWSFGWLMWSNRWTVSVPEKCHGTSVSPVRIWFVNFSDYGLMECCCWPGKCWCVLDLCCVWCMYDLRMIYWRGSYTDRHVYWYYVVAMNMLSHLQQMQFFDNWDDMVIFDESCPELFLYNRDKLLMKIL